MSSRHITKHIWHFGFVQYQFVLHSEIEPNRRKLRQGSSEEFWLLAKSGLGMEPCKDTNYIIFIEDITHFQIR